MKDNRKCLVCLEVFFRKPTTSKKEWGAKCKYCSKACWYKTLKTSMRGNSRGFSSNKPSWNKGKEWTKEHKQKLSEIHLKNPNRYWENKERRDLWAGEIISYSSLHKWVYKQLGKPETCERCGKTNMVGQQINWANKSHKYLKDASDWLRLCVSCHKKHDKK